MGWGGFVALVWESWGSFAACVESAAVSVLVLFFFFFFFAVMAVWGNPWADRRFPRTSCVNYALEIHASEISGAVIATVGLMVYLVFEWMDHV